MKESKSKERIKINVLDSLDSLINEIVRKMTENTGEIETMQFEDLLKTIQSLSRTVQNFIKIIELTNGSTEANEEETNFIERIISDPEALELANKLLERLVFTSPSLRIETR